MRNSWNIQHLKCWGRLPLEVVFISIFFYLFRFALLSLSLRFEEDPINGCWHIQILKFEVVFHYMSSSIGGYIPLEVFFHWMSSSIGDFLPLRKIWSVVANSEIFKFQYFEVIFQLRSSSYHAFKILVWFQRDWV